MKRYIYIVCAVLLFAGCQTDPTTDVAEGKYLTVSIEKTRTSLGDKVGENYPVYWSADDQIVVNGELSGKAQINGNNKSVASFLLSESAEYPYLITYPYCASTTATTPVVEFPAEQSYVEGSYDVDCAPMCGYAANGQSVALKNLATILRFPVKGIVANTTLDKVVITSTTAQLAGEFSVDCQNATIEATSTATNSVTYTVNQTLSTSEEMVLHISLPAVNAGRCSVEFFDTEGGKMSAYLNADELSAGVIKEFKCINYGVGTTCTLEPLKGKDAVLSFPYLAIGHVKDSNGNPIEGVAVSDGITIVRTDENGRYEIKNVSPSSWFIYITIPAEYEIPVNEYGQACFFKRYDKDNSQYNFTLTPLAGGKEKKFALFAFADPQVGSDDHVVRMENESVPAIKAEATNIAATGVPCYGITLGDIINNSASSNKAKYREPVRNCFAKSKVGMPVFHVYGNHDYSHYNEDNPLLDENGQPYETWDCLEFQMRTQREHEEIFGPVNYSFDRGDTHIIGLRNFMCGTLVNGAYTFGIRDEHLEWLRQDLAGVSKDKMVVLCVHIPMHWFNGNNGRNIASVLEILNEYPSVHIISGHTHYAQNYEYNLKKPQYANIYEHTLSAVCGAWWRANIAGDGTPNGYGVFVGEGATFTDWYYLGVNEGMNTREHQLRLHWGDAITGSERPADAKETSRKGYYKFNFAENVLLANIYNADSAWKIEVYENGTHTGDMSLVTAGAVAFSSLLGSYTYDDPKRPNVETRDDMYTKGLFLGTLGYNETNGGGQETCFHLYKYQLKSENPKDTEIMVKVIDRFGVVYEYTNADITEGTDYSLVKKP